MIAPDPTICAHALCDGAALAPYFAALQARLSGRRSGPIHILLIGDSHSAGDNIAGAWREVLQARFGDGGRGMMPPGHPFDGYRPRGVTVEQSAGWSVETTLHPLTERPMFGLSGFRVTARQAGARLGLTAQHAFDRVVVCGEAGPGAGDVVLRFGPVGTRIAFAARTSQIACTTTEVATPQTTVQLTTEGGPVTLTSWGVFSGRGGVTLSNLGVIGAQLRNFARYDDQAAAEELRAYQPDLIVLAFGTNEGFADQIDHKAYEAGLRAQIERLKRLTDGTPILLLGAPDAAASHGKAAGHWAEPAALAQVRAIQRRVAGAMDVAFWDWASRMGGDGTAARWSSAAIPLMRPDHVHYTAAGGAQIAGMLQADLDQAASKILRGE